MVAGGLWACQVEPNVVGPGAQLWPRTSVGLDDSQSDDSEGDDSGDSGDDDIGDPGSTPCERVDLLFVIDNSRSMEDEQDNLVASFPGFIRGIESVLGPTDYHVGVVTTDSNPFNDHGCQTLGALTTRTGGLGSSDRGCGPYADGGHYMTAADDLSARFACAAKVGTEGDGFERPIDALAHAVLPLDRVTTQCNRGFLRDDALLVVVLITDEEDEGDSVGDPQAWYEQIVRAKHGDEGRVVMLSLVGHEKPNDCIASQWNGLVGAELAPRLIEFTEMFSFGQVGDVCAPQYDDFFVDAIGGIASACMPVVPVK